MKKSTQTLIVASLAIILIGGFFLGKQTSKASSTIYEVDGENIVIDKSKISATASFIPYELSENYMEIIAIKSSDGSIRTALNTCQVCYDSGRGNYNQVGDKLICNNCRNVFSIEDVEIVRGGCNPIPITGINKVENAETITVSGQFLKDNNFYFARWQK